MFISIWIKSAIRNLSSRSMDASVHYDTSVLPDDVFSLSNDGFYNMIRALVGEQIVEILKVQLICSTQSLLRTRNIFEIFDIDCPTLSEIRQRSCFQFDDGSFIVKNGLKNNLNYLLSLFLKKQEQMSTKENDAHHDAKTNNHEQIVYDLVNKYPLLKSLVTWYEDNEESAKDHEQPFLQEFISNITSNLSRSKHAYRYVESVQRFAMALHILGGQITYEFVRINLSGAQPNLVTLKSYISNADLKLIEGEFRIDSLQKHLNSIDTNYGFGSEDCTGVIRKIKYDKEANTFLGFSTPLNKGIPTVKYFQTDSFEYLKTWFGTIEKAPLLNVHMFQPVVKFMKQSSPFLISAYGVNSRYTSVDIMRRWSYIYQECQKKHIRIIGFSTGMFTYLTEHCFKLVRTKWSFLSSLQIATANIYELCV